MVLILALALASASSPAAAEGEALGIRLARTGTLATLLPIMVAKETEELVAGQKTLSDTDKAQLRVVAADQAKKEIERVMAVEGHAYAQNLSLTDLQAVVGFNETPVAARFRAVQPNVIAATMKGLAGFDFKKVVLAAYCAKRTTGICGK